MWEINATKYFHAIFKKILVWKCKSGEKEGLIFQPCGLFLPETVSLSERDAD